MIDLEKFGWTSFFGEPFRRMPQPGSVPAACGRRSHRPLPALHRGRRAAGEVSGRFRHEATGPGDFPAVGDWVVASPRPGGERATIHAVLPRRGRLARKVAGEVTSEQVLAANVDTLFLVGGLDGDFNPRRIERALVLAWDSGAEPGAGALQGRRVRRTSLPAWPRCRPGARGRRGRRQRAGRHGLESLGPVASAAARPSPFSGPQASASRPCSTDCSGPRSSATAEVRPSDDRGRHTTSHRELFLLPGGALVVDTPGIREIQLWADDEDLDAAFRGHCGARAGLPVRRLPPRDGAGLCRSLRSRLGRPLRGTLRELPEAPGRAGPSRAAAGPAQAARAEGALEGHPQGSAPLEVARQG